LEGQGNPAEVWDYLDLLLLRLAKLRRRPLNDTVDSKDFYNEFFTENDVAVMGSGGDLRRDYRAQVLRETAWANMPHGAEVLDVGCGVGDNLRYVLRDDARFFGLEYASRTAEIARRLLDGRATVDVGSATAIPYTSARFDLALCIEVLEHVDDDWAACREIARVLKPGGALILSLPYRRWFPYYFTAMGHIRHYTRSDVVRLLDAAGFDVERYLPNFPHWSRFANYVYVSCRIYALMLRLFGIRRTPVEVRLPWVRRPLMASLFGRLESLWLREQALDYSHLETSTFVLARKR
jgi:SAM-dependent methyltransferase